MPMCLEVWLPPLVSGANGPAQGCLFGTCSTPGTCDCVGNVEGALCDRCAAGFALSNGACQRMSAWTLTTHMVTAICGDGVMVGGELCDDKNQFDGDGCSSTCTIEDGFSCSNVNGVSNCTGEIIQSLNNSSCTLQLATHATLTHVGTRRSALPRASQSTSVNANPDLPVLVARTVPSAQVCQLMSFCSGKRRSSCPSARCTGQRNVFSVCAPACLETCETECEVGSTECAGSRCVCPQDRPVWDGEACITRDECPEQNNTDCADPSNGPEGMGCKNGGICIDGERSDGQFTCDCSNINFIGANCETSEQSMSRTCLTKARRLLRH